MRGKLLTFAPLVALVAIAAYYVITQPLSDLYDMFVPAGDMLRAGVDPYALNEYRAFVYPPPALPVFVVLSLASPVAYVLIATANVCALWHTTRMLGVSSWWVLYPQAVFVLMVGQLDILVTWLCVYAVTKAGRTAVLVFVVALLVKPQVAAFWALPYILRYGRGALLRVVAWAALVCAVSMLTHPGIWSSWLQHAREQSGYYATISTSLWTIAPPLAVCAALAWLAYARVPDVSRAMLALALPVNSVYSVGMLGAAPSAFVGLAYALLAVSVVTGARLWWLEAVCVALWGVWEANRREFQLTGNPTWRAEKQKRRQTYCRARTKRSNCASVARHIAKLQRR